MDVRACFYNFPPHKIELNLQDKTNQEDPDDSGGYSFPFRFKSKESCLFIYFKCPQITHNGKLIPLCAAFVAMVLIDSSDGSVFPVYTLLHRCVCVCVCTCTRARESTRSSVYRGKPLQAALAQSAGLICSYGSCDFSPPPARETKMSWKREVSGPA